MFGKSRLVMITMSAVISAVAVVPAQAAKKVEVVPTPPPACDAFLTSPNAVACSGFYEGNVFGGSLAKIDAQKAGVDALPGTFTFDGNWGALESSKIQSLSNINQLDFGTRLYGETIIGAHFGNISGPATNVSVFWLLDFGTAGADYIRLDDTQGFSNAVLYTTGTPTVGAPVPEPAAWAMMLVGFGATGFAMRRRKQPKLTSATA